jgi:DNA uptake protein ComE-like DNA-binding protein
MTTPEQLLADPSWRRRHSVYTLWTIFGFGFVSLLYTGARAKRNDWMKWGAIYGVVAIPALAVGGSLSPEDPDAPAPLGANLAIAAWAIVWIISAIHVFRARKEWLRWKASTAGQARWYETPASSVATSAPAADLSNIGLDDPTSEYLAGPPPVAAPAGSSPASTGPPQPPTASGTSGPPPPPAAPAPRATERPAQPAEPTMAARTDLIDLNTASVDDIAALPGVGVATAHRIVEERQRRGGFESVDEAAIGVNVQPHVRARLQKLAVVSQRQQPTRQRSTGRIVDI